jgi:hypothetical protein
MRFLAPAGLLLLFSACGATDDAVKTGSAQRATYNGGSGSAPTDARGFLTEAPELYYPEHSNLFIERTVEIPSTSIVGAYHLFREALHADGQGNFSLEVTEVKLDSDIAFSAPSPDLLITYQEQQRYMVEYRDIHLGLQHGLSQNFRWIEDPVVQQVAGIDCIHYTAESIHDLGNAEFWADANSGLILGYTMLDSSGDVTLKLTTTFIDTVTPNHANIAWSTSLVDEEIYDSSSNSITLDFTVSEPSYLPPGFYQKSARVLDSFGMIQGMGNLYVALYTDGIHQLFVAQHSENNTGAVQISGAVNLARFSETGGICMVEGNPPFKKVYVVGQMPRAEIHTVFSSLF